jgi:CRP-like cAMP-binding protein
MEAHDTSNDVYLVVSGMVRVHLFSHSGKETTFRDVDAGGMIGDLAAIDGGSRSASIVTLESSVLLRMSASTFLSVLAEYPSVAMTQMRRLAGLVRDLSDRLATVGTVPVPERIRGEVLRLARAHPAADNQAIVRPYPKHHDIASRVGTHREAVTRELGAMSRAGLIQRSDGALVVLDVEALASTLPGSEQA